MAVRPVEQHTLRDDEDESDSSSSGSSDGLDNALLEFADAIENTL